MLQDKEIRLRPIEKEDVSLFKGWYNDFEVTSVVSFCEYMPRSTYEEELWIQNKLADNSNRYFIILFNEQAVGYCAFSNLNLLYRSTYLSIVIGEKQFKSKGLGTRVINLIEDYLKREFNIRKISVYINQYNEHSINLFKKCGYLEQGRLVEEFFRDGKYIDILLFYKLFKQH